MSSYFMYRTVQNVLNFAYMATKNASLSFDEQILAILDQHLDVLRKSRTVFIQDLVREYLESKGLWPPKKKKG